MPYASIALRFTISTLRHKTMTTRQTESANILISEQSDFPVIIKMETMKKGYVDEWHKHPWHQIVFPFEGILQTIVANRQWVVPHNGMLFIPANTYHESFVMAETKFIGIYLNPDTSSNISSHINVDQLKQTKAISVTPFLRELILHINCCVNSSVNSAHSSKKEILNLVDVLVDQICDSDTYDMTLLLPRDRRLMQIFKTLMENPQLDTKLSAWAKKVGASERTLSRLFMKELGMSFPLWRQHLRLVSSLSLLATHCSIQEVAYEVGYHSDSSFIYAFKNVFKQTPQQYRHNGFMLSSRVNSI